MRLRFRSLILFLCFVVCAILLLRYQSNVSANKLFGNRTYRTTYPDIPEVTLANGRYVESYKLDGFFSSYFLYYEGHHVYGDFNQDGLQDVVVILSEGEAGSGDFRLLAFLINDGSKLVHQSSEGLGDRVIINSLKERDGKVVLDMFVHGEHDCRAGPTKRVQKIYAYLGPDPAGVLQGWAVPEKAVVS